MPFQWRNQIWQSLEKGTGKRCSECGQYPKHSEGADRVSGQLHGDKKCPFSGVTKSSRVWRKVPESDARSVVSTQTFRRALPDSVGRV